MSVWQVSCPLARHVIAQVTGNPNALIPSSVLATDHVYGRVTSCPGSAAWRAAALLPPPPLPSPPPTCDVQSFQMYPKQAAATASSLPPPTARRGSGPAGVRACVRARVPACLPSPPGTGQRPGCPALAKKPPRGRVADRGHPPPSRHGPGGGRGPWRGVDTKMGRGGALTFLTCWQTRS